MQKILNQSQIWCSASFCIEVSVNLFLFDLEKSEVRGWKRENVLFLRSFLS